MGMKKQKKSFTLIEVLVATFITVSIIITIYSTYTFHHKAYQAGENIGEVIQNGRVILERLTRELRQADEIVTVLGETQDHAADEIEFEDGHLSLIKETQNCQGATQNTITLSSNSSLVDDYYSGAFIKIISGPGQGQIREILEYNGSTKVATIKGAWETLPTSSSVYKIDTSYYYIRYFLEQDKVKRQVIVYYFENDPDTFVPWSAISEDSQHNPTKNQIIDEEIIGEYVQSLKFWGKPLLNISLSVKKGEKSLNLFTKVFGRNL